MIEIKKGNFCGSKYTKKNGNYSYINAIIVTADLLVALELIKANYEMNLLEENRFIQKWQIVLISKQEQFRGT